MSAAMQAIKQQNPRWEDLDPCILSQIFSCLSPQDQLFGPPHVCRAWLSATLDTLFSNSILDLRLIDALEDKDQRSKFTHLLKIAIDSDRKWVAIRFPSKHTLGYSTTFDIAEKTPTITSVYWPTDVASPTALAAFMSLMHWRNIRVFHARMDPDQGFKVLSQLADFCINLVELGFHGKITEKEASCVIKGFPGLKVLDLSGSSLSSEALGMLLDGRLMNLREVNVLHCLILDKEGKKMFGKDYSDYSYFKAWRNEILERAFHLRSLKKFMHCLENSCQLCVANNNDREG